MGFLTGIEIRHRIERGDIEIHSLDSELPFNMDSQVTEDSVDLRISPVALSLREDVTKLDYLQNDLEDYYDLIKLEAQGFELEPLRPIIAQTLEAVCFPDDLVGLVFTRSTFARLGILTTCMAPKFAVGIHWAFPLQLVNLNRFPIRIYPYAPMAQLMISDMTGEPIGYRGRYQDSFVPRGPQVGARERESLSAVNSNAVNRTFHIINHDLRLKGATPPAPEPPPLVAPQAADTPRKPLQWLLIATLSTLAALGFGVVGNLIAGGSLQYWQIVSIVLLLILSAVCTAGALLLQAYWNKEERIV